MAANSFIEMSRSLRLYVPSLPITLAQQMIRDRYRRILERRPWSGLRGEGQFLLAASKTAGTIAVTFGSPTAVGTGTAFASTDVGRQIRIGTGGSNLYSISAVNVGTQTLTLEDNVGVATNLTSTYGIFDAYVTCPTDFMRFINVTDPRQGWRLWHWITQDELLSWDPQRTYSGQPYALVDRRFSTISATSGRIQYEAWPYNSSERSLAYSYIKRGADLINDDDIPIWPIRSDAIVSGALADAARWPGTIDAPNPYFTRPDTWQSYQSDYEDKLIDLERQDEDIYMTWLQTKPSSSWPMAPISANFIQSHAV